MTCEDIRRAHTDQEDDRATSASTEALAVHFLTCLECRVWRASDERVSRVLSSIDPYEPSVDFTARVMADVRDLARGRMPTARDAVGNSSPFGHGLLALHGALAAVALVVVGTFGGLASVGVPLPSVPSIGFAPPVEVSIPTFGEIARTAIDAVSPEGDAANVVRVAVAIVTLIIINTMFSRRASMATSVRLLGLVAFGVFGLATGTGMAAAIQETSVQSAPPDFYQSIRETSDSVRILLLVVFSLGVGIGVSAVSILFRTYAAAATAKVDHVVRERSGLYQLFIGTCDAILVFVLIVATARIEPLKPISLLLIGVVFFMVALGFAARARAVGRDVLALGGAVRPELAQTLVGSGVLIAILFVPILGQILWLVLLAQCLGTAFLGLLRRGIRGRATLDER
jgi:hypothetical protein